MADLTTTYMGLKLRNPIIVSSSDLTKTTEGIIRCYEAGVAGVGAVALKSIYEEQFLIKEDDEVAILTDILGLEDALGDMDFKVQGICVA